MLALIMGRPGIAAGDLFPLLRSEALKDNGPSQFVAVIMGVLSMHSFGSRQYFRVLRRYKWIQKFQSLF